ncbi:MAG TPA: type II toxin-antitoxin system RelE/ParE family toxin [Candidatus Obscuribacter sp.]|nr:type II toxin-antitoxin system RelE/ParE family toxin [Candidatus Obscuribacter sp.]HMX44406.1 type II toxin-antitoxin system RelE/ParE family toxin [Candidatus Obscuribacter sp.]HMY03238.1 type II toxin-antitoxin system RelE/ParE family toxin [Candidatus Obscuribacter sp.]HMY55957.1 type II toxin-antitoxin system RelE/ParE family toxin [Candidatus Obscuribacter sp.]HNB14464.1 type II toxin-antitoxin system RelE/ParE family toxin [Candidatus Obscuribacter sp.]
MGSAEAKDFRNFPDLVQDEMGFALYQAQIGRLHSSAKPLKGFSGASVVDIVSDHQGDTYRSIYTIKFHNAIYALHAFQKKSKKGIKTPQAEIDLIMRRLKTAEEDYKAISETPNEKEN